MLFHASTFPARTLSTGEVDSVSKSVTSTLVRFLMPMPVMDIRHVIVLMLLGGMFVFMGMSPVHNIMSVHVGRIVVPVAVFME